MIPLRLCIYILVVANLLAYLLMWIDKALAIRKQRRVPEKYLFVLALFAAPGIYLGMWWPLYHKAAKPLFKLLIPIMIVFNFMVLFYLFRN